MSDTFAQAKSALHLARDAALECVALANAFKGIGGYIGPEFSDVPDDEFSDAVALAGLGRLLSQAEQAFPDADWDDFAPVPDDVLLFISLASVSTARPLSRVESERNATKVLFHGGEDDRRRVFGSYAEQRTAHELAIRAGLNAISAARSLVERNDRKGIDLRFRRASQAFRPLRGEWLAEMVNEEYKLAVGRLDGSDWQPVLAACMGEDAIVGGAEPVEVPPQVVSVREADLDREAAVSKGWLNPPEPAADSPVMPRLPRQQVEILRALSAKSLTGKELAKAVGYSAEKSLDPWIYGKQHRGGRVPGLLIATAERPDGLGYVASDRGTGSDGYSLTDEGKAHLGCLESVNEPSFVAG